ncbi:MAG: Type secretion system protein DotU, partial [Rhizobacter sp.]|nr:Type secretion system protein DotU [Rhizobacter sp.]
MWNEWRSSASHLLAAAVRIRTTPAHPDPADLVNALSEAVVRCNALAIESDTAEPAWASIRLVICRRLDEALASTTWGSVGVVGQGFEHRFAGATTDADVTSWVRASTSESRPDRDAMALLHAALALSASSSGGSASSGDADDGSSTQSLREARLRLARRLGTPSSRKTVVPAEDPVPQPAPQPASTPASTPASKSPLRLRDV